MIDVTTINLHLCFAFKGHTPWTSKSQIKPTLKTLMQSQKEEDTVHISIYARWRGPSKISVCWLNAAQTSNAVARKTLGHFTVSSQEEQIASALHDRSRAWPERGLCLPRGMQEWHGLAAQGGMWSGVTGTWLAWEAALPFPPVFPNSPQSCSSGNYDVMQQCRQPPWWVSLKHTTAKSEILLKCSVFIPCALCLTWILVTQCLTMDE